MIDVALYLTYFLVIAAVVLVLGFAVWFLTKNIKKSKNTIIGALGLVAIFLIAYFISSGEVYEKFQIGEGLSKTIGGALITLYIMFFGTIIIAIYTEIAKLFK
jgi:uncharacterized membrane protein YozB (DUF420 family)